MNCSKQTIKISLNENLHERKVIKIGFFIKLPEKSTTFLLAFHNTEIQMCQLFQQKPFLSALNSYLSHDPSRSNTDIERNLHKQLYAPHLAIVLFKNKTEVSKKSNAKGYLNRLRNLRAAK